MRSVTWESLLTITLAAYVKSVNGLTLLIVDLLPLRVSVRGRCWVDKKSRPHIQLANNSCPNMVLETQDGDSDGYKVRNYAVPLLWQACSSGKPPTPGPEPVIPSPFLSTTFTLSFLFIYFIPLNNHVLWPVKNREGVSLQLRKMINRGHKKEWKEHSWLAIGFLFFSLWFEMQVKEDSCKWQITF